jgi:hypothetical protein
MDEELSMGEGGAHGESYAYNECWCTRWKGGTHGQGGNGMWLDGRGARMAKVEMACG